MAECPPVLLLVCDRPDLTRRVVERIREARPRQLYVGADGPRGGPGAEQLAEESRAAAQSVDWDCDVRTLLSDRNLGCKRAVGAAVTWFFETVDAGIVLEDDCVPDPAFFRFCGELLDRYSDDERVMGIGGNNFDPARWTAPESYTFSVYNQTWGWATWRRAWRHYDGDLRLWPRLRPTDWLERFVGDRATARFWRAVFDRDARGEIDTWDFAWTFACWTQHGLTVHPAVNLVSNVGFDERAAHTRNAASPLAAVPARAIEFPLVHPYGVRRDYDADTFTAEHVHRVRLRTSRARRLKQRLVESYRARRAAS